ncbi:MAG: CinA family protein [Clostridia bacterium]|nr:CinA family protein [Clostridia bacterium]
MEQNPSRAAFERLRERGEHVSFAESLTGGLIAATLIANSGASDVIDESYVTYAAESKIRILGVRRETVEVDGVVSARCAREMAEGVRRISGADWGVSATGLAGPDGGTEQTPVGTVFIGVAGLDGVQAFEFHFGGDRAQVRKQAVDAALTALTRCMEGAQA